MGLLVQEFAQTNIKGNIKVHIYRPSFEGNAQVTLDSTEEGPVIQKGFPCRGIIVIMVFM